MSIFRPEEHFEPSKSTLSAWLNTKKQEQTAFYPRPGLFNNNDFFPLVTGMLGILILEGIATYYVYSEGIRIAAIIASIMVDFLFAIGSHYFNGRIVKNKNRIIFEEKTKKSQAENLVSKYKSIQQIFNVLILLNGIAKFVFFYIAYQNINAEALLVLVAYITGSILHLMYSGYFFLTLYFEYLFRRDRSLYINSNEKKHKSEERQLPINNDGTELIEVEVGKHRIAKKSDGYYFELVGILTDDELTEFARKQKKVEQQVIIIKSGVYHQYNMLG